MENNENNFFTNEYQEKKVKYLIDRGYTNTKDYVGDFRKTDEMFRRERIREDNHSVVKAKLRQLQEEQMIQQANATLEQENNEREQERNKMLMKYGINAALTLTGAGALSFLKIGANPFLLAKGLGNIGTDIIDDVFGVRLRGLDNMIASQLK
jgi:hypothetical protein